MRGHLLGDGGGGGHDKRPELLPRALLLYLVSDRVEDPRVDALAALLGGVADLGLAREVPLTPLDRYFLGVFFLPFMRRAAASLSRAQSLCFHVFLLLFALYYTMLSGVSLPVPRKNF